MVEGGEGGELQRVPNFNIFDMMSILSFNYRSTPNEAYVITLSIIEYEFNTSMTGTISVFLLRRDGSNLTY